MKLQKQVSDKKQSKIYHKFVVVIPEGFINESGFKEGDELEAEAKRGEIKLRKKV